MMRKAVPSSVWSLAAGSHSLGWAASLSAHERDGVALEVDGEGPEVPQEVLREDAGALRTQLPVQFSQADHHDRLTEGSTLRCQADHGVSADGFRQLRVAAKAAHLRGVADFHGLRSQESRLCAGVKNHRRRPALDKDPNNQEASF